MESEEQNQAFLKALEKSMTDVLTKEDNFFVQIKKDLLFKLYELFTYASYRRHRIHSKFIVELPDFLKFNRFELEGLVSEEFNYRKKVALAFALEPSEKSFEEFIAYRQDLVEEDRWEYLPEQTLDTPSPCHFKQLLFRYRRSPYYKSIYIHELAGEYLVITIVAPPDYLISKRNFIRRLFATFQSPEEGR